MLLLLDLVLELELRGLLPLVPLHGLSARLESLALAPLAAQLQALGVTAHFLASRGKFSGDLDTLLLELLLLQTMFSLGSL